LGQGDAKSSLSAETLALMKTLGMILGPREEEEEEVEDEIKVF
jgi:hypothetical protein